MDCAWGKRRYSFYFFLSAAPKGGEWSASRPGRASRQDTHCTVGWVGPRAGVDSKARENINCPCWDSNLGFPVRSLSYPPSKYIRPTIIDVVILRRLNRRNNIFSELSHDDLPRLMSALEIHNKFKYIYFSQIHENKNSYFVSKACSVWFIRSSNSTCFVAALSSSYWAFK
jgi:hypothetical protein